MIGGLCCWEELHGKHPGVFPSTVASFNLHHVFHGCTKVRTELFPPNRPSTTLDLVQMLVVPLTCLNCPSAQKPIL